MLYATGSENCPVASYIMYVNKLNPKLESLFQRPKSAPTNDGPWYDAQVIGTKTLAKMMKRISIDAKLSMIYTNHCIRATSISVLDSSGFEARHIMSVSGHRQESSIRSYSKTDLATKRRMSDNLAKFIGSKKFKPNFSFGLNLDSDDDDNVVVSDERKPEKFNRIGMKSLVENYDGQIQFSNCVFKF